MLVATDKETRTMAFEFRGQVLRKRKPAGVYYTPDYEQPSITEWKVLVMIADGCDNYEIALDMGISPNTVRTHIESLRHKLRARDKVMLVARGFRLGILQ